MSIAAERLIRATKRHPCPICGGWDKCSFNNQLALCARFENDKPAKMGNSFVQTWIHKLGQPIGGKPVFVPDEKPSCITADREVRDRVYRAFLKELRLEPRHLTLLYKGGIAAKTIFNNMYRSVPEFKDRWRYAQKVMAKGYNLRGIPGFFQMEKHGKTFWTFIGKDGVFIPVYDIDGYIVALRIRYDKPDIDSKGKVMNKYKWFSAAGLLYGCGNGSHCHVAKGATDVVWITEGEKKADAGRDKTGKTFISVPGVGDWAKAIKPLKALSPKRIVVAYDADKVQNPDVRLHEANLIETLKKEFPEVVVCKAEWDLSLAKGIDDLFVLGLTPKYFAA